MQEKKEALQEEQKVTAAKTAESTAEAAADGAVEDKLAQVDKLEKAAGVAVADEGDFCEGPETVVADTFAMDMGDADPEAELDALQPEAAEDAEPTAAGSVATDAVDAGTAAAGSSDTESSGAEPSNAEPIDASEEAGEEEYEDEEPENLVLSLPFQGRQREFTVSMTKFKVVAAACVLGVGALLGAAGYIGYGYYHYFDKEKAAYAEYKAHKADQDAKLQSLLEDNEKMLRDMSEIHTLETKLRRAVIRNSDDKTFTSNIDNTNAGSGDAKATDPNYLGKGGPGTADMSMVAVLEAQNKNLTHQIDEQKSNMNELLSTLEGRNNKRSTFPDLWPTSGGTISSPYGGRTGPIEGGYDWHPGVDIAVEFGTPIYASAMGTVEMAGWNGGYGRYVRIDHGNGYESAYGHMSGIAVQPGQQVRKGEIIGFVGSSGYSTGPHVHFEVLVDGKTIDPMYMLNLGKATNEE